MAGQRKQYPSQARLRELFDYDPEGFLVWKWREEMGNRWNGKFAGKMAGSVKVSRSGVIENAITIAGSGYPARSLIWIYFNGDIEQGLYVTNKDGNPVNCKIENLSVGENTRNPKLLTAKGDGLYGVDLSTSGAWRAHAHGKAIGVFATKIEAATAYDNLKEKIDGSRPNGTERKEVTRITAKIPRRKTKTKGTSQHRNGRYYAKISIAGKSKHIGTFDTQEEAARAYNIAAYERYGEHAVLNDIPDPLGHGDVF